MRWPRQTPRGGPLISAADNLRAEQKAASKLVGKAVS